MLTRQNHVTICNLQPWLSLQKPPKPTADCRLEYSTLDTTIPPNRTVRKEKKKHQNVVRTSLTILPTNPPISLPFSPPRTSSTQPSPAIIIIIIIITSTTTTTRRRRRSKTTQQSHSTSKTYPHTFFPFFFFLLRRDDDNDNDDDNPRKQKGEKDSTCSADSDVYPRATDLCRVTRTV